MNKRTFGKKICVWCGKEFIANSPRQNSCGDEHYMPCIDCGKPVLVKESYQNYIKAGGRRCAECRAKAIGNTRKNKTLEEKQAIQDKIAKTNIEKYGVVNPMQNKEIYAKAKHTVQERYGVDNLSQSKEIQNKIKENSMKKYGVSHYSQDPNIRKHMVQGMIDKYGVDHPQKCDAIKEKTRNTNLLKYGVDNPAKANIFKEKAMQTNMDKYGVPYAAQAPEIIKKRTETNYEKYGASAYIYSKSYAELHPNSNNPLSTMEKEVINELHNMGITNIDTNNRLLICPYEIDIYLPDYKIGIECNATATHNSTIPYARDNKVKPYNYHKMKTDMSEKSGIFLFHIFGYEWTHKRSIIISMLKNLLGKCSDRVYARNCEIRQIDSVDCAKFLNDNHRQGAMQGKIRLGLFNNNELISVMTFNKMRTTIGLSSNNTDDTWELGRFCSKLDTNVIGGASKLFNYFIKNYKYDKIISYSDRAHTKGKLYELLGFTKENISDPGYVWVNINDDSYYNRVQCQKQNLRKLFNNDKLDIEHNTEKNIMMSYEYVQVFDSGVIRWEYNSISKS